MFKERYTKQKGELLSDNEFNPKNLEIIKKFLEFEEYKLKRKEGLAEVDEKSYKTLYSYLGRLKRLNEWFNNLNKEEISKCLIHCIGILDHNCKFKGKKCCKCGEYLDSTPKPSVKESWTKDFDNQFEVADAHLGNIISDLLEFLNKKTGDKK